ncbi:putative C-S lyase [Bacteroides sp. 214]|uniref:MalY/PatB family protein n=1 Tax=Bacteroides sp. 214 TaxID=2302935 RepID=UPI0013D0C4FE|nr:PatB family C-S lyase [Bacteroides sp. 214]NDW11667.1 putative C-S lyase [Bacteroides sp. 214]
MRYNFDEVIDRSGTDAEKVEGVKIFWNRTDLLPMWVADMDFRTAPFIVEALRERLDHEILGYTFRSDAWYDSIIEWLKQRFEWNVTREMLNFSPGVVPGFTMAIQQFTQPGDKIMVQTPVYHPFFLSAERNHREVVYNPLKLVDGRYEMDMPLFEAQIKDCKMLILCNPQNPSGRVWTKDELQAIAKICYESNVLVVSDEIHADLTFPQYRHYPFATVSEEARINSITLMSPSKAFNMPGLSTSYAVIPNEELCKRYAEQVAINSVGEGHLFAFLSVAAAYSQGTDWLHQVLAYVQENIDYMDSFLKVHVPKIKVIRPQASYLVFLDCRELGLSQENLLRFFEDGAHLALNNGAMFGANGEGFMRINVGCPRVTLEQAMKQLRDAFLTL